SVALRRLCFDDRQSGFCSDLIEKITSRHKSRFWQHGEKLPRRICRRRTACETVSVDHRAVFAGMRPIDSELPRPARTEAFDVMRYRRGVLWLAAAPFPRIDSLERLLGAHEPSFFHPAGMAHEATRKQLGIALIESPCQGVDQSHLADIGIDHRKVAV